MYISTEGIAIVITALLGCGITIALLHKKRVKTSDSEWLKKALNCYKGKKVFILVDDAPLGIEESDLKSGIAIIKKAKQTGVPVKKIIAILTGLGLSAAGIWLIAAAIADPEPTSKLGILLAGGVLLIVGGGYAILRALGYGYEVSLGKSGFKVKPVPEKG